MGKWITSLLVPSRSWSRSSRMDPNFEAFCSKSSCFIFLVNLTRVLVATNLIDLALSFFSVCTEKSTISFCILAVYSLGIKRLSEQVDAHHRLLPLRYAPMSCSFTLTTCSINPGRLVKGFLMQNIWMSSIKRPSKIIATSYLFQVWFGFELI